MRINISIAKYAAAAILVTMLGGLAGWYVFVKGRVSTTDSQDSARGFGSNAAFTGETGSTYSNILAGISGKTESGEAARAPQLWQITRTPVAGLGFAASSTKLFFVERASGNVLTAEPMNSRVERLTNTLQAKVSEAYFAQDGSVVLRFVDAVGDIVSIAGRIATSSSPAAGDTPNTLDTVQLPKNIVDIDVRSNPPSLFFIAKEAGGGTGGVTSDWRGSGQKRVLTSALSDWDAIMTDDGAMYIAQKASDNVSGYAYRIAADGTLTRVLGDIPGLAILPRSNSSALLYSSVEGANISLFGRSGSASSDVLLPVRTIVDKCVWAPGATPIAYCAVPQTQPRSNFLREWYMGLTHTSDAIWRINVSGNTAERIFMPDASISLDIAELSVDPSGRYLAFLNNADKTLWMYTIQK